MPSRRITIVRNLATLVIAWTLLILGTTFALAEDSAYSTPQCEMSTDTVCVETGIIFVPAACVVGPRTTAVIDRLCAGSVACAAEKIATVCEVTK